MYNSDILISKEKFKQQPEPAKEKTPEQKQEANLDEELEDSFPASDPGQHNGHA